MPREVILPGYAKALKNGRIEVDADEFYPAYFEELGVAEEDIDQYWLEVAFTCMKLDIQRAVAGTALVPKGGAAVILVKDATKKVDGEGNVTPSKWAIKAHPKGRGVEAAVQGKEAREHYKRIRGGLI